MSQASYQTALSRDVPRGLSASEAPPVTRFGRRGSIRAVYLDVPRSLKAVSRDRKRCRRPSHAMSARGESGSRHPAISSEAPARQRLVTGMAPRTARALHAWPELLRVSLDGASARQLYRELRTLVLTCSPTGCCANRRHRRWSRRRQSGDRRRSRRPCSWPC